MKITRWMKNKITGVCFPYNEAQIKDINGGFLVECTADEVPDAEAKTKAPEPQAKPQAPTEPPVIEPPATPPEPQAKPPKVIKMPDAPLEHVAFPDLQDLAEDMGIVVKDMKKADVIKAIRSKQSEAAEKAADETEKGQ